MKKIAKILAFAIDNGDSVSYSHLQARHPGGIWSHVMSPYDYWKTTDVDGERPRR